MVQQSRERAALLLMDLQRGIIESHADAGFLARIKPAIAAARTAGLPVIWVRVVFRSGHPEVSQRNQQFSTIRQTGRLIDGDEQSAIHPALGPEAGDVVVTKRRVGAFSGSDLDYRLTVLKDGCADADPDVHRVLMEKVFPRQATVLTISEWTSSVGA